MSANRRYLEDSAGSPVLIHGDTMWSGAVQLTTAEMDLYLNDRKSRGFNAINVNLIEHKFTGQIPKYRNINGHDPFALMTDFGSTPVERYWAHVDALINGAKSRGMIVFAFPAYLGFNGGDEGWASEVAAESAADLQAYGVFLANRYRQGNIVWCMGGDYAGSVSLRDRQWSIVSGLRSVRSTEIVTGHPARSDGDAYSLWASYPGFNLNLVYTDGTVYSEALTAYARSGPIPFFMIESRYENNPGVTRFETRSVSMQTMLSGGCGWFYGNANIWGFGYGLNQSGNWQTALNDPGGRDQAHLRNVFVARQWWKLVPDQTATVCTAGLGGSGTDHTMCAIASDRTFAIVYVPAVRQVSVDMTEFSAAVTARWIDPTSGVATLIGTFPNTGSRNFTPPGANAAGAGDWTLTLDT